MNLFDFRVMHSTLLEHYQFIEFHLEGICAALGKKPFADTLEDVEKHSLGRLVQVVRRLEGGRRAPGLSSGVYDELNKICADRNFWSHCCYTELDFDPKTGGLKRQEDRQRLSGDLRRAEEMRELLYRQKVEIMERYRDSITLF